MAREVEKKLPFSFEPMGEKKVKNISELIPVYRVRLDGGAAQVRRGNPVSAMPSWARPVTAALVLAVAVAAATWFGFMRTPTPHLSGTHVQSIAVLPFDDLSPDKSLGYLGDGVSEDIISMLSRFPEVSVIARNSSFVYKGKPIDVRQVGANSTSAMRSRAASVRMPIGFVSSPSSLTLRLASTFGQSTMTSLERTPRHCKMRLPGRLSTQLPPMPASSSGASITPLGARTRPILANTITIFAATRFYKRHRRATTTMPGEYRKRASRNIPISNLLKVKLGWYHFSAGWNWWSDDVPADFRKAGELVRAVLAKDNLTPQVKRLADQLFAFVLVTERDFSRALNEADTAIALAPYDATMIGFTSAVLIMSGKPDKALGWIDLALARDPTGSKTYNYNRGWAFRLLGKNEDSIAAFKQSSYPDGDPPLHLAIDLVRLGRIDEAKTQVKLMLKKNDPKFTQAKWRQGFIYSDPSITDSERRSRQGRPAGEMEGIRDQEHCCLAQPERPASG